MRNLRIIFSAVIFFFSVVGYANAEIMAEISETGFIVKEVKKIAETKNVPEEFLTLLNTEIKREDLTKIADELIETGKAVFKQEDRFPVKISPPR